ncbi:MAG: nucleotidyltransferase family protein [Gammaproteobacteria bacterium]|nr:nucleotidyltransferase family protein [Gammaproteobacteria bacterium]
MRAMILAAGRGERMRPLTDNMPKPLIPVNGKPLIEYHLEKLAVAGVTDVVINHAWLGQMLVEQLGDGRRWGLNIHFSNEADAALETAGGIANALPLLGDAPFWVINGDVWTDFDFSSLPQQLSEHKLAHLLLTANPEHHPSGDFGLVDGEVRADDKTKYTYSGIGLYHPSLFSGIGQQPTPLGPLLRQKIAKNQISGQLLMAQWADIGTPQRLALLESQLA